MVIEIDDTKTIAQLQDEFSAKYPYLKIEFFEQPHGDQEASAGAKFAPQQVIGQVRQKHVYGIISLEPTRQTGAVEQEFAERFGLNVQVYRKLLDRWAQTSGTDALTLGEQNAMAGDSAGYFYPDHELTEDNF